MKIFRHLALMTAVLVPVSMLWGRPVPVRQDTVAAGAGGHDADGGGCIPVLSLAEEDLAYQAGEHFDFTVHYSWGIINSDVGKASVDLDTMTVDGRKVFFLGLKVGLRLGDYLLCLGGVVGQQHSGGQNQALSRIQAA